MLSEKHKREISIRFNWNKKEIKNAIQELDAMQSLVRLEEIFNICLRKNSIKERWKTFTKLLDSKIEGDLSIIISNLLFVDPSFKILALFNLYDLKSKFKDKQVDIDYTQGKSFIDWRPFVILPKVKEPKYYLQVPASIDINKAFYNDFVQLHHNPLIFPETLSNAYIEMLIRDRTDVKRGTSITSLLKEVVRKTGFLALRVDDFRNILIELTYKADSGMNDETLVDIAKAISNKYLRRKEITERKYWLMYAIAESLQNQHGLGVRQSFREAGKLLLVSDKSIHRRYYERLKIINEESFSFDEIIFQFHLRQELSELLKAYTKSSIESQ